MNSSGEMEDLDPAQIYRDRLQTIRSILVDDIMTQKVITCSDNDPLVTVIETLTAHSMGAVLIQDQARTSLGVISKTDLIIAYHHGVPPKAEAS